FDVFSFGAPGITVGGNSLPLIVNAPLVSVDMSCEFYSQSTCGHDPNGRVAMDTEGEIRRLILRAWPVNEVNGAYQLRPDYMEALEAAPGLSLRDHALGLMALLAKQGTRTDLDRLYADLVASPNLDAEAKARLSYHYYSYIGEWLPAHSLLADFAPESDDAKDWAVVERVRLALQDWRSEVRTSISLALMTALKAIAATEGPQTAAARGLLQFIEGGHPIELPDNKVDLPEPPAEAQPVDLSEAFLEVFPNPATDYTTLRFNIMDLTDASVHVHDLQGRKVYAQPLTQHNGELKLDLSAMAPGMYLVSVQHHGDTKLVQKLVKK
ncbi:MAG: T9SS type A sorting domain-containing protein, partial [Bacteroidota bacterium]